MTIINFMPAHKQAPVALWLLKKDVAAAAEKIAGAGAQAVLVPAGDEVSAALADALGESCRVIECDPSLGFVYANGRGQDARRRKASPILLRGRWRRPLPERIRVTCRRRQALGVD